MKSRRDTSESDLAPPHAASLVESLRAFGYDLSTALADLADNSLFHGARNIALHFHWDGTGSAIAISDDGTGMDEATLVNAMRVGSRNPRDKRDPADLGRFGLGLKTASFSQCRRVTVLTRRPAVSSHVVRTWDLDHIAATDAWQLLRNPSPLASALAEKVGYSKQGTIVVWENLDRLTQDSATNSNADEDVFLRRAEYVGQHFATMFHRLMGPRGVAFSLNGRRISPWDPFLSSERATQPLPVERLKFEGHLVEVEPFVLPHLSKVDAATHKAAAGTRGWNAHQGFYIYRNRRLLVAGDWLGLKGWRQEEHYKLARIRLDLPNALDHAWEIDVTKSRACPPERLRADLTRIAERTRSIAKQVYSFRGAKLVATDKQERVFLWGQIAKHNCVSYRLNREHPMLRYVKDKCTDPKGFAALLRLIEETIPVPLITITDRERPDQTVGPFEPAMQKEVIDIMRLVFDALLAGGLSQKEALLRIAQMDPFPRFPDLLATLAEMERS